MKKLRSAWQALWVDVDRRIRLGRILGFWFVIIGFVTIGKAWDGAASINFAQGQIPYLLSGGAMGLALVATGALLLLLATVRAERQIMSEKLDEVSRLLGRNLAGLQFSSTNGGSELAIKVVAASAHYHTTDCKVLQGKIGLVTVSLQQAVAEGLQPCRVCDPPRLPEQDVGESSVRAESDGGPSGGPSVAAPTTEASGTPTQ
ncbi:MAG: hypothetical protein M3238_05255 [Actinomycetota bacterium]|nr:hypothetical protein [Actinomycetota bacterium]